MTIMYKQQQYTGITNSMNSVKTNKRLFIIIIIISIVFLCRMKQNRTVRLNLPIYSHFTMMLYKWWLVLFIQK